MTSFLTREFTCAFLIHSGTGEKSTSNGVLAHWLCGTASGRLPFPPKPSPEASLAPESIWLLNHPCRSLPPPPPHLQMLAHPLPKHRTRLTKGRSQQRSNYWVKELPHGYESIFLCHGNQREGASATEYERLASMGASGLGDFSSPHGNMMLFSPNSV